MKRAMLTLVLLALGTMSFAQPKMSSPVNAPSAPQGGTINEVIFGDITTLNPVLTSSATEAALISHYEGPAIYSRAWAGTRAYTNENGEYNLGWASDIEIVVPEQEFIITVREGWKWSDGTEMTVDDIILGQQLIADPEIESNSFSCAVIDDEPVVLEKINDYQYRATLPKQKINGIISTNCGTVPAHVFGPVYEAEGAAGVKAMWGVDADVSTIVSGGPYLLDEFRQGERMVFRKNPVYGTFSMAANGDPLPGPDMWVVDIVEDQNQVLARTVTGQSDFYYPSTLDQVRAVQSALNSGSIGGDLYANLGPGKLVDFITYNFNNTDECKRAMFREPAFRQAVAVMIDRQALIDAALGGLGFPGVDYRSAAVAPFVSDNAPFEFSPERGLELLGSIGFTREGADGVLVNPDTGCRAEFDLQYNSGNDRRAQEALVISQTLAPYGVKVNPREVDVGTWADSIVGTDVDFAEQGGRTVDYDAQIWGLAGGDIDDPSFSNGLRLGANLNAWNKSKTDVEAWEILMERLDVQIEEELDLQRRIELYKRQMELAREYLPMTPLISPAFHFYENLGNVWSTDVLGAVTIESPYRPGNSRANVVAPQ